MLNKISTKKLQEKGVALNNSIMERCWVQYFNLKSTTTTTTKKSCILI